jgi:hypothetical protein
MWGNSCSSIARFHFPTIVRALDNLLGRLCAKEKEKENNTYIWVLAWMWAHWPNVDHNCLWCNIVCWMIILTPSSINKERPSAMYIKTLTREVARWWHFRLHDQFRPLPRIGESLDWYTNVNNSNCPFKSHTWDVNVIRGQNHEYISFKVITHRLLNCVYYETQLSIQIRPRMVHVFWAYVPVFI